MDMRLRLVIVGDDHGLMVGGVQGADGTVGGSHHLRAGQSVVFLFMPREGQVQDGFGGFPARGLDPRLLLELCLIQSRRRHDAPGDMRVVARNVAQLNPFHALGGPRPVLVM